ncbi:MAG: nodulation protein NfeD [Deltaproteobacteria bacterium]|nr:nodulation protein NfeD [Deltaproteobacteria bacterium]
MKTIRRVILSLLCLAGLALNLSGAAPESSRTVYTLTAVGSINPGLAEFIIEGVRTAEKHQAEALVVQLDTPGGLDSSMRQISQAIVNAKVPVIVYVGPRGARAASAGVLITVAAHVAAMAPGTNIGAAHPVALGTGKLDKVMGQKMVNDMVAYGRALALERGRNADWVEKAIRQSVSVTAAEAQRLKVVDFVAEDLAEVLQKAHDQTVKVAGKTRKLNTQGVVLKEIPEGLRIRILKHIADPNIAFILMMIGLAGLYFELAHPGAVFPGVVGTLSLLLALYAFQSLPVSFIGLLLILLAFIFFILEIYITSYGLLTLAGVSSLFFGSMMLYRGGETGMDIAWGVLIPTVLAISLFFIGVAVLIFRTHLQRSRSGRSGMVGERGTAYTDLAPTGRVFVHGEYWQAVSDEPVKAGDAVEVVAVVNLKLRVRRAQ